ncbi:MAG: hypothetical protein AB7D03_03750 [Thiomicrospira sp.]
MSVIESIVKHEGFRSKPYPDPIRGWDVPTFGHGLTTITEDESRRLVENRVSDIMRQLDMRLPFYRNLPNTAQDVLIEMAYQMGVDGLLEFKNTLAALADARYRTASAEMLDSLWASKTPRRAKTLSDRIKALGETA